jgi:ABC-type long-subunit fatty acid transport system fused permease/ATPase subunit
MMCKTFFTSKKYRWRAIGLVLLLLIFLATNLYVNYSLSQLALKVNDFWSKSNRDHEGLYALIILSAWIRFGYVLVDPFDQFFSRHFTLLWRWSLSEQLLKEWSRKRQMTKHCYSSQLIQGALFQCTQFIEDMGSQIIRSCVMLTFYLPTLWELSKPIQVRSPWAIDIHGILVMVVLAVAAMNFYVSYRIGLPLFRMNQENQNLEASLRSALEKVEFGHEPYDSQKIDMAFATVYGSWKKILLQNIPLKFWDSFSYHIMFIIPFGMVGLWYIDGLITFGVLGQIFFVFNETSLNLRTMTSNWGRIIDFLSTRKRLMEYIYNLRADNDLRTAELAEIRKDRTNNGKIVYLKHTGRRHVS